MKMIVMVMSKEVQIVSEVVGALAVFTIDYTKANTCCAVKQVFLCMMGIGVIMMIGIP